MKLFKKTDKALNVWSVCLNKHAKNICNTCALWPKSESEYELKIFLLLN